MSSRSSSPSPANGSGSGTGTSRKEQNTIDARKGVKTTATRRLTMTKSHLKASSVHKPDDRPTETRWNPNWNHFPPRRSLQRIPGAPQGAAWFWGPDDYLGRINLLTPARVLEARKEIRSGEIVSVNLPLHEPAVPAFSRTAFKHKIYDNGNGRSFDDLYQLNTQSGTQWDGFRHTFYNNTKASDILGPDANPTKCSIHHWSQHGIAGRAVLLDFWSYAQRKHIAYNPYGHDAITLDHLKACARHQRIDIRPTSKGGQIRVGDILLIRTGFTAVTRLMAQSERDRYGRRPLGEMTWSGLAASEDMVDWLHDCYFAAVGQDGPAFEVWPAKQVASPATTKATTPTATNDSAAAKSMASASAAGGSEAAGATRPLSLHEYMLALWGMPIGELFDLEELALKCRERERWFFFFTSAPANVVGGVASHVNGQCIL